MTEPISLKSSSYKSQSTKPEKYEMMKLFSPISAKWHQIGDLLKVDPNTMEGLRTSTFADEVKLSIMLQKWLENAEPTLVTWDNINRVKSLVTSKPPSMYFDLYHISIVNMHILQTMNDTFRAMYSSIVRWDLVSWFCADISQQ